jgi:DNA-binding transcriptional MerR regulator/methylmalonyl-CoA mutase cobalamin-binding subunit
MADVLLDDVLAADQTPVFNTAAVARRSGVLPATFRAWERRYGFPTPRRQKGNRRGYSEQDVLALGWLRGRLEEGMTISAALTLLRNQLNQVPPPVQPAGQAAGLLAQRLEQALLEFDAMTAQARLAEAFALYPVESVCLEVIQPALVAIGDGWHAGRVDAVQEHFASAFLRGRLLELLHLTTPTSGQRTVAVASAPNDWHEIGALMVGLFLSRRGWQVRYLGASLPPDGLERSVQRLQPTALVISATTDETAADVPALAAAVEALPPPRPIFAFGGRPFEAQPALRERVPGVYLGPDALSAVERLERAYLERQPDLESGASHHG